MTVWGDVYLLGVEPLWMELVPFKEVLERFPTLFHQWNTSALNQEAGPHQNTVAGILTLDFQPAEWLNTSFVYKLPSVCYFVTVAPTDEE